MGLGFLNQPSMDAQKRKESKGLGLLITWRHHGHRLLGSSLQSFSSGIQVSFCHFFLSFWYLLLRERVVYMCVGTGGPSGGAKTLEKETQKQNDVEGSDSRQTMREQPAYFTFTFTRAERGRNRMHSGLSTKSKYLFCLIGDPHWNRTD